MTIGDLRYKIEAMGDTMNFCIEDVFSWRGSYDEAACYITPNETTKEHNLEMIDRLLTHVFEGWKGGEYTYDPWTQIHFEQGPSEWSDDKFLIRFLVCNSSNDDVKYIFT